MCRHKLGIGIKTYCQTKLTRWVRVRSQRFLWLTWSICIISFLKAQNKSCVQIDLLTFVTHSLQLIVPMLKQMASYYYFLLNIGAVIVTWRRHYRGLRAHDQLMSIYMEFQIKTWLKTYRLSSHLILNLNLEMTCNLQRKGVTQYKRQRNFSYFLASGPFQHMDAFLLTVFQLLMSLMRRVQRCILFPNDEDVLHQVKLGFQVIAGFPKVRTYVLLIPPSETKHVFCIKKHTHSPLMCK